MLNVKRHFKKIVSIKIPFGVLQKGIHLPVHYKVEKIYKTTVFRHWTADSKGIWSPEKGNKWAKPYNVPGFLFGQTFQTMWQGGESEAEHKSLGEL